MQVSFQSASCLMRGIVARSRIGPDHGRMAPDFQLPFWITAAFRGHREPFWQIKNSEHTGHFCNWAISQKAQITVQEHETPVHRQQEIPLADRRCSPFRAFQRGFNLKFLLPSPKLAAFPTRTFRTSTLHSAIHFGRHWDLLVRRSCSGLSIVWRFPVGRSWLRTVFRCSL